MSDTNQTDVIWDKLAVGFAAVWASLVRTLTPSIVGYLLSLLTMLGVTVDPDMKGALTGLLTVVFGAGYYLIVRLLEQAYGWASLLLLSRKTPVAYGSPTAIAPEAPAPIGSTTAGH